MGETAFAREDRIAVPIAVALHIGVVALLVLQPAPDPFAGGAQRMTVSLASEVSLEATAPAIVPESRAAIAPTLSDDPSPASEPVEPQVAAAPLPDPRAAREPRPANSPVARPAPTPPQPAANRGGSRIGNDFLTGQGGSTSTDETRIPASQIGPSAKASIVQAIVRQVRPHWTAPQGIDADRLVSVLAFELDEEGRLKGRPRVINQSGLTDSNRPQAPLHAERAIRAVQLAAPFDLPDEYYNAWKSIRGARFDRNLSQ
ncbi:MAG: energy transducer TonB [Pseudomonadota bacterium]